MTNPLLAFWQRLLASEPPRAAGGRPRTRHLPTPPALRESTIFLVLRRMRAPLIAIIVIYAVSVLGLTLMPGVDAEGRPWRMSLFHAFYFMSYTATTIGFGEIPYSFSNAQRMWVTFSIYLTVIGWAWAIGTLLALLQDHGFRRALAMRGFARRVRGLHEPFVLVAGYGQTGQRLVRSLDLMGRNAVVLDIEQDRIDDLALASLAFDVPGLTGDARIPDNLLVAGLAQPNCTAVIALTNDDEANLAVTMTAALLRPDVRVFARTMSTQVAQRMCAFGTPVVIDPFDRYGDYLRVAIRSPASFRLIEWLSGAPGNVLPRRRDVPAGRWIVSGFGRFGQHVAQDLRAEGMAVTVIEPGTPAVEDASIIVGYGTEATVLQKARIDDAVGFIAATANDTANLSMVAAARSINPRLYVIARQNDPSNRALFRSIGIDFALIPSEVVSHEVLAHTTSPLLFRFLTHLQRTDDAWAAALGARMVRAAGEHLPPVWRVELSAGAAPAIASWFAAGRDLTVGALLGGDEQRNGRRRAVVLMLVRSGEAVLAPGDEVELALGDELLLAGLSEARRALAAILVDEAPRDRALLGIDRPAGSVWRWLHQRKAVGG